MHKMFELAAAAPKDIDDTISYWESPWLQVWAPEDRNPYWTTELGIALLRQVVINTAGAPKELLDECFKESNVIESIHYMENNSMHMFISVKETKGGYIASLPVARLSLRSAVGLMGYVNAPTTMNISKLRSVFGSMSKDTSVTVPAKMQIDRHANMTDDINVEALSNGAIKSVTFKFAGSAPQVPLGDLNDLSYINSPLYVFLDTFIPMIDAQSIAQSKTPRKSQLGLFFQQNYSSGGYLFTDPNAKKVEWTFSITNLSDIAKTVPKTNNRKRIMDDWGTGIDNRGHIFWVPDVDNTLFAEAQMEAANLKADGTWCTLDLTDEEHGYETVPNSIGVMQKQRKDNGRDSFVWSDWHNMILSYTDGVGVLKTMDLSFMRKTNATDLYSVLNTDWNAAKHYINVERMLVLAMSKGWVTFTPQAYKPKWQANYNLSKDEFLKYSENSMKEPLASIGRLLFELNTTRDSGTELTPCFKQIFDVEIFANIAKLIVDTQAYLVKNYEAAAKARGLRTFMSEMGLLTVIVEAAKNINKITYEAVKIVDGYRNPKLDDPKTLKVSGVPFVSGSVSLFPHQGKAWNYIKNAPLNAIQDIAAGGGKCTTGDTLVATSKGLLSLSELWSMGDQSKECDGFRPLLNTNVLSLNGVTSATKVYKKPGKHKLLKITLADGTEFKGLPEHRLHNGIDWVYFRDIAEGDLFPKYSTSLPCATKPAKLPVAYNDITHMTTDLAFYLGAIVSEGTKLSPCNTSIEFISSLKTAYFNVFGEFPKETLDYTSMGTKIWALHPHNAESHRFLEAIVHGVKTSIIQDVPKYVRMSLPEHQCAFLTAYFEGDGSIEGLHSGKSDGYEICASTISKRLAVQLHQMLNVLGFNSGLVAVERKSYYSSNGTVTAYGKAIETKRIPYTVWIDKNHIGKFQALIGFVTTKKINWLKKRVADYNNMKLTKQTTNSTRRGIYTKLAGLPIYNSLIDLLNTIASGYQRTVQFGRNTRKIDYTIQTVLHDVKPKGQRSCYFSNPKELTQYHINTLDTLLSLDHVVAKAWSKNAKVLDLYNQLKVISKQAWIPVVGVTKLKPKTVYDLHVPESNSYVANGFMNHNTLITLLDIANLMGTQGLTKPLIICPSRLIPNYVNDANMLFRGKMNLVVVNGQTYNSPNWGPDKLRDLIEHAPVNTIFITDYDFTIARKGTSNVQEQFYGPIKLTKVLSMEFLKSFDWGGIWADECVAGNTLINTSKGLVRIDSLAPKSGIIEANVWTPNGKQRAIAFKKSNKSAISIVTRQGYNITGSHNHPVQVYDTKTNELVWKPIKDIRKNDLLCIDTKEGLYPKNILKLNYTSTNTHFNTKTITVPKTMSMQLAKVIGYVISEGHINKNSNRIEFINFNKFVLKDCLKAFKYCFPDTKILLKDTRFIAYGKDLVSYFEYLGVSGLSKEKEVPWSILQSTKEHVVEFIRSYSEGDGGVSGYGITWTSKSTKLLKQLQILLLRFNITTQYSKHTSKLGTWYRLVSIGYDSLHAYTNIGFCSQEKITQLNSACKRTWSKTHHDRGVPMSLVTDLLKQCEKYHVGGGLYIKGGHSFRGPLMGNRQYRQRTHGVYPYANLQQDLDSGKLLSLLPEYKDFLYDLLAKSYYFSPVTIIRDKGKLDLYDIEVPKGECFIGNGLAVHNCHLTKNYYGSTNRELAKIFARAKYKRQLSGTYISDNLTDVVGEFALIDPTVFGTPQDFEEKYFVNGTKRSAPIIGAQQTIRDKMSKSANVVTIRRKEWAALLPERIDEFHPVEMSEAQKKLYLMILSEQKDAFLKDKEANAKLKELTSDTSGDTDENDAEIENLLTFYIARMEQFLTAPGSDPVASMLSEQDKISPKIKKIEEILTKHISGKIPGKILIWTQYVESAASIFRQLSPKFQKMAILYTASTSVSAMSAFKTNPEKLIMVGCEKSMNTGENLQVASRIIRLENVWNWGTLEQGESRINRPLLKDFRKKENGGKGIFYDWVFCNSSVDITKTSRMISKLISTVKFYEKDPEYQNIVDLEPIKLSAENIFNVNDWRDPVNGCAAYFDAYGQYAEAEAKAFEKFRLDPESATKPVLIEDGPILKGSGLLEKVPYVAGQNFVGADKLGLINFLEYMSSTYNKKKVLLVNDPTFDPNGMRVHCEYGDCIIRGFNRGRKTVRVTTPDGSVVSLSNSLVWVITKDVIKGTDIRKLILKEIGAGTTLVTPTKKKLAPTEPLPSVVPNKNKPTPDPVEGTGIEMYMDTYQGFITLIVDTNDDDVIAHHKDFLNLGFTTIPSYMYTRIKTVRQLRTIIDVLSSAFEVRSNYLNLLEDQFATWKKGKSLDEFAYGLASSSTKNFLQLKLRPLPPGVIAPYLVSNNDSVYLCFDTKAHVQTITKLKRALGKVPNTPALKVVENELWHFATTKQEVKATMKEVFNLVTVLNKSDLIDALATTRVVQTKKA